MALNEVKNPTRLPTNKIQNLATQMLQSLKDSNLKELKEDPYKYQVELEKRNQKLKDHYPGIFKMIMLDESEFDMNKLKMFLNLLDQRNNNEISKEDSDNIAVFRQFKDEVKEKIDWEKEKSNFEKYNKFL